MNYKIKITAENQAIVKRIADENRMNPNEFGLDNTKLFYIIENGIFDNFSWGSDYHEITTELFAMMFDKRNNFKLKVIELFEKRINICKELIKENTELNKFSLALTWQDCMVENIEMLKQINEIK